MESAYEEQESSKAETEKEGTCQVRIVHDMFVNTPQRVQHGQRFRLYMRKVESQFYKTHFSISTQPESQGTYLPSKEALPQIHPSQTQSTTLHSVQPPYSLNTQVPLAHCQVVPLNPVRHFLQDLIVSQDRIGLDLREKLRRTVEGRLGSGFVVFARSRSCERRMRRMGCCYCFLAT